MYSATQRHEYSHGVSSPYVVYPSLRNSEKNRAMHAHLKAQIALMYYSCDWEVWTGEVVHDQDETILSQTASMTWGSVCNTEVIARQYFASLETLRQRAHRVTSAHHSVGL